MPVDDEEHGRTIAERDEAKNARDVALERASSAWRRAMRRVFRELEEEIRDVQVRVRRDPRDTVAAGELVSLLRLRKRWNENAGVELPTDADPVDEGA